MSSSEWKVTPLSELCGYISRGVTPAYTEQNGVVVLNQKCIRDNRVSYQQSRLTDPDKKNIHKDKYLQDYDILINSTGVGTLGRVAQINKIIKKTTVDSHVTIVRAKNNVNARFLGYNLFLQQSNIEALAEGSTGQTELSRTRLAEAIKVRVPSLPEQKDIADTLSCLDDKIELNICINKNLEEMAQAIFKSWFVDFEPFQDGEFEDSELGRIPKGWKVGTLGDISSIASGKRPLLKQDILSEEMCVPVVGASCIMAYTKEALIDEKILITGRVGTHGVIQRFNTPCWPSDNTLVIRSEKYEFVNQILNSIDYKSMNRGSTQPLITQTDLKNIEIVVPSDDVLENYEKISSDIMDVWTENNNQSKMLILIRDFLLPKLMSGEIRVPLEEVQ